MSGDTRSKSGDLDVLSLVRQAWHLVRHLAARGRASLVVLAAGVIAGAGVLLAAGCGGAGNTVERTSTKPATKHFTAAQRKYMGSQYCTSDWNDGGRTPSGESPPMAYGQFLTIYPKIRIYEIRQSGPGVHPAFTCALIAATRLNQISDVYADTFDGRGWRLDQVDAHSMQVNGVSADYPPNASITASGHVRLWGKRQRQTSRSASSPPGGSSGMAALHAKLKAAMLTSRFVGKVPAFKLTSVRLVPLTDPAWADVGYKGFANGVVVGDHAVLQRTAGGAWVVRESGSCRGLVVPARFRAALHTPTAGCSKEPPQPLSPKAGPPTPSSSTRLRAEARVAIVRDPAASGTYGQADALILGALYVAPTSDPTWAGAFFSYSSGSYGGQAVLQRSAGNSWVVRAIRISNFGSALPDCSMVPERIRPLLNVCPRS